MSGMEILGALASAAQLAEFGIKITAVLFEILERLQEYPARLRAHIEQVRQLVETAELISKHPVLHNQEVQSHLKSTLLVASELQTALEQLAEKYFGKPAGRRFWKIVLKGAVQEKQIESRFESLERQKSALIFCITVVHAGALASIQGGVDFLVDVVGNGVGCEVCIIEILSCRLNLLTPKFKQMSPLHKSNDKKSRERVKSTRKSKPRSSEERCKELIIMDQRQTARKSQSLVPIEATSLMPLRSHQSYRVCRRWK